MSQDKDPNSQDPKPSEDIESAVESGIESGIEEIRQMATELGSKLGVAASGASSEAKEQWKKLEPKVKEKLKQAEAGLGQVTGQAAVELKGLFGELKSSLKSLKDKI